MIHTPYICIYIYTEYISDRSRIARGNAERTFRTNRRIDACAPARVAEMSRISNRVATIGAALTIVLLVILLVILWSDVRNVDRLENLGRIRKNTTTDGVINERKQIDLRIASTDLIATFESIEQNLTNEGESLTYLFCLCLLFAEKQILRI